MTSFSSGNNPSFILPVDINNDGNIDLVVANGNGANTVTILFGDGNGVFTNETMYTTGLYPMSLTAGTFRDQTNLDLAVANTYNNDISFFFNSCS